MPRKPLISMKLVGARKARALFLKTALLLQPRLELGMDVAAKQTAKKTRDFYVHAANGQGFDDQTGALRKSIKGEFIGKMGADTVAIVGAGDNTLGTNGKPTRFYALKVELSDFDIPTNKKTPFLRPAAEKYNVEIVQTIAAFLLPGAGRIGATLK